MSKVFSLWAFVLGSDPVTFSFLYLLVPYTILFSISTGLHLRLQEMNIWLAQRAA